LAETVARGRLGAGRRRRERESSATTARSDEGGELCRRLATFAAVERDAALSDLASMNERRRNFQQKNKRRRKRKSNERNG